MTNITNAELNRRIKKARRNKIIIFSIFGIVFLFFVFFFISLFPANREERYAFEFAQKEYKIQDPHTFKLSTRNKTVYYSVIGMTENGNTLAIFDRNGNTDELIKTSKLVSAKKIEKILEENKFKKINNISPSIYKKVPVYEISFFAKNGTLSYLTIDIKNGEIYRKITGV